jgi:hypothetical protein
MGKNKENKEKKVKITETEYLDLAAASTMLAALYEAGVEDWEGYSDAIKIINQWAKEDEEE